MIDIDEEFIHDSYILPYKDPKVDIYKLDDTYESANRYINKPLMCVIGGILIGGTTVLLYYLFSSCF